MTAVNFGLNFDLSIIHWSYGLKTCAICFDKKSPMIYPRQVITLADIIMPCHHSMLMSSSHLDISSMCHGYISKMCPCLVSKMTFHVALTCHQQHCHIIELSSRLPTCHCFVSSQAYLSAPKNHVSWSTLAI